MLLKHLPLSLLLHWLMVSPSTCTYTPRGPTLALDGVTYLDTTPVGTLVDLIHDGYASYDVLAQHIADLAGNSSTLPAWCAEAIGKIDKDYVYYDDTAWLGRAESGCGDDSCLYGCKVTWSCNTPSATNFVAKWMKGQDIIGMFHGMCDHDHGTLWMPPAGKDTTRVMGRAEYSSGCILDVSYCDNGTENNCTEYGGSLDPQYWKPCDALLPPTSADPDADAVTYDAQCCGWNVTGVVNVDPASLERHCPRGG